MVYLHTSSNNLEFTNFSKGKPIKKKIAHSNNFPPAPPLPIYAQSMTLALEAKFLHHVGLGINNIIARLVFLYFAITFNCFLVILLQDVP
jgi:hypothetical protein